MSRLFRRGFSDEDLDKALAASYRHAAFADGSPADDGQIQQELHEITARASRLGVQGPEIDVLEAYSRLLGRVMCVGIAVVFIFVGLVLVAAAHVRVLLVLLVPVVLMALAFQVVAWHVLTHGEGTAEGGSRRGVRGWLPKMPGRRDGQADQLGW